MNPETPPTTIRLEELPHRRVCVVRHPGTPETVDATRRPLYQHMIMHELVQGPSIIRFHNESSTPGVDALVIAPREFEGDEVCTVEDLPAGTHAILDYHGPSKGLPGARAALQQWVREQGYQTTGTLLQVHLMDEMDGETEQQLQIPVARA